MRVSSLSFTVVIEFLKKENKKERKRKKKEGRKGIHIEIEVKYPYLQIT
jgi:hypothetical protein